MEFGAQVTCYRNTWDSIKQVVETLEAGPWSSLTAQNDLFGDS